MSADGELAYSCAADCTVKVWKLPHAPLQHGDVQQDAAPVADLVGQKAFLSIDCQYEGDKFATCGSAVDVWDAEHSEPIDTFSWGCESTYSIRFNPVRTHPSPCMLFALHLVPVPTFSCQAVALVAASPGPCSQRTAATCRCDRPNPLRLEAPPRR